MFWYELCTMSHFLLVSSAVSALCSLYRSRIALSYTADLWLRAVRGGIEVRNFLHLVQFSTFPPNFFALPFGVTILRACWRPSLAMCNGAAVHTCCRPNSVRAYQHLKMSAWFPPLPQGNAAMRGCPRANATCNCTHVVMPWI